MALKKFTQIGIFGLKRNHLATLLQTNLIWLRRDTANKKISLNFFSHSELTDQTQPGCQKLNEYN
jgi:hypothetical protein